MVLESNRPGHLDTLGLDYETMRVHNPRLVWCSLTGFGDFGPNAMFPGHDLTYLGYSGLLSYLADGPATPPGTVLSLPLAGLMAAVGILAALREALEIPELREHRFGLDDDAPVRSRLTDIFRTRPALDWLTSPGLTAGSVRSTGSLISSTIRR